MPVTGNRGHIVYCWEMGGGLGHIYQLAIIARALVAAGYKFSAILKDTSKARSLLNPLDVSWYQAPVPGSYAQLDSPTNHADILHCSGYDAVNSLVGIFGAWSSLLSVLEPSLVITEAAPSAMMISKVSGYKNINLDSGYLVPGLTSPMPPLRYWVPVSAELLIEKEERTLNIINRALYELGKAPILNLSEFFRGDTYWLNWYELKYFENADASRYLGPVCAARETSSNNSVGGRAGIVVYLKPNNPLSISALRWSLDTGMSVFAYLPDWPTKTLKEIATYEKLRIFSDPIDLDVVLPHVSLMICHGGHGSVCKSIAYGVVPLIIPTLVEQYIMYKSLIRNGFTAPIVTVGSKINFENEAVTNAAVVIRSFIRRKSKDASGLERLMVLVNSLFSR